MGELATYFEYGLNVAAKEYDGENKYIRITDIDDESHEFRQDNLTSPDTDLSVFDKYKLSDGDLLFSRTGASVGKSYIYKASDGLVYYAGFLIRARIKEENNSEFVYQNTLTSKYVNFIKVTSMRSGQPGVNAQEYSQFEIRVPSKVEQDTITYYFSNLDHLITLHQSKCFKYIYAYTVGRILSWEQRKLGEIFKEYSEKNHVELPPLTIIQGGGTIRRDESDRALQYDKGSLSNYKMVNKDDFIVHLRSFEGGLEKANSIGIISPAYYTFSGENTDTTFYYTYFRSKKFVEIDLKPHVYGIRDGRSIDIEGMKTIKIPYTIYKEQMCIGKAIDVIDHLITLHQLEPYYRIFKAIAYRIIDYAEYKFFNVKINLIYDIIRINIA